MPQQLSKEQLIDIAKQFGTPVYIYHAERIEEQLNELQSAFKDCKARFFMPPRRLPISIS
jgi:diaminopimelate decarboxylase